MEITDFKDFYIDINGDVKATVDANVAKFLTTTDKLNSEYLQANTLDELRDKISEINTEFVLDETKALRQYSIKTDIDGNLIGIKVYYDYNKTDGDINYVLMGYDITSTNIDVDHYFVAPIEAVNALIESNKLVYEIKNYETHQPFLHSIKKNESGQIINFKTYYALNENIRVYNQSIIPALKQTLKF
jgi:hypothetical protein